MCRRDTETYRGYCSDYCPTMARSCCFGFACVCVCVCVYVDAILGIWGWLRHFDFWIWRPGVCFVFLLHTHLLLQHFSTKAKRCVYVCLLCVSMCVSSVCPCVSPPEPLQYSLNHSSTHSSQAVKSARLN
jgi:hypothetical protein